MPRNAAFTSLSLCFVTESSSSTSWRRCTSWPPHLLAVPLKVLGSYWMELLVLVGLPCFLIAILCVLFSFFGEFFFPLKHFYIVVFGVLLIGILFLWRYFALKATFCPNSEYVFIAVLIFTSCVLNQLLPHDLSFFGWRLRASSKYWCCPFDVNYSSKTFLQCTGTEFPSACCVSGADLVFYSRSASISIPLIESCCTDY